LVEFSGMDWSDDMDYLDDMANRELDLEAALAPLLYTRSRRLKKVGMWVAFSPNRQQCLLLLAGAWGQRVSVRAGREGGHTKPTHCAPHSGTCFLCTAPAPVFPPLP